MLIFKVCTWAEAPQEPLIIHEVSWRVALINSGVENLGKMQKLRVPDVRGEAHAKQTVVRKLKTQRSQVRLASGQR